MDTFYFYSDTSSLLGVRLPPDTEIIKYTSSIVGPKVPGTTNRGRKKTISLEQNALLGGIHGGSGSSGGGSGGNSSAPSNQMGQNTQSAGHSINSLTNSGSSQSAEPSSAKRSRLVS